VTPRATYCRADLARIWPDGRASHYSGDAPATGVRESSSSCLALLLAGVYELLAALPVLLPPDGRRLISAAHRPAIIIAERVRREAGYTRACWTAQSA
jgi:hypothetical protein